MSQGSASNSKLVVPVMELLRRPGSHRTLSVQVDFDGLATSDAEVRGPVDIRDPAGVGCRRPRGDRRPVGKLARIVPAVPGARSGRHCSKSLREMFSQRP